MESLSLPPTLKEVYDTLVLLKHAQFDRININGQQEYYIQSIIWGFHSRTLCNAAARASLQVSTCQVEV